MFFPNKQTEESKTLSRDGDGALEGRNHPVGRVNVYVCMRVHMCVYVDGSFVRHAVGHAGSRGWAVTNTIWRGCEWLGGVRVWRNHSMKVFGLDGLILHPAVQWGTWGSRDLGAVLTTTADCGCE